ncbi:MAG: hypothetical protein HOV87_07535 [Catenulispora sp.]|nr:hypothetical protein [Catenulispora sp.]
MADMVHSDVVERLVREHVGTGFHLRADSTWLTVRPYGVRLQEQGWKLHVSSRVATFPDLVARLLPVLLAEGCAFKLARDTRVLTRLNDGISSPAAVGKAFTVYPDDDRVQDLGERLVRLLRGHEGPRVLSDRRVDPQAPVYYRYGPFVQSAGAPVIGGPAAVLHGPQGQEFEGLATMRYRQPAWSRDPFTGETAEQAEAAERGRGGPVVLAGRYEIVSGLFQSGRGDLFRAVDRKDAAPVIVKQARAFVDENDVTMDVRMRMRNERRILTVLAGVEGVPRFIDHFQLGTDEYLVTEDVGAFNLADDVTRYGRYLPAEAGAIADSAGGKGAAAAPVAGARSGRTLERLASGLARILLDVHARGVTVRDLSPRNIVVDGDRFSLIDFGMADHEGLNLHGGTPGYMSPRQAGGGEAHQGDDLYSLGMVLAHAASGLPPVIHGEDLEEPRQRVLETVSAHYGPTRPPVMGLVSDLLGPDDIASQAVRRLAQERLGDGYRCTTIRQAAELDADLIAAISDHLLEDLKRSARVILNAPADHELLENVTVYDGLAGIGLELLENLHSPDVVEILEGLVPLCVRTAEASALRPGLFTGRTGVDLFVARARQRGIGTDPDWTGAPLPDPDWKPEDFDLMAGASGIGLGHLALHDVDGRVDHLAVARRCAEHVAALPPPDQTTMPPTLFAEAAVDASTSRAHGLAGTVELLVRTGSRLGDEEILRIALERALTLAERAREYADLSRGLRAAPLSASWCQGMAGFAQTLLGAGRLLEEPALIDAAHYAAEAANAHIPRMDGSILCCGLAGIGTMAIDLALHDPAGGEAYWDAAHAAGAQMLLRRSGPPDRPTFVRPKLTDHSASLALGVAGIHSFFRRLGQRGGADPMPFPSW